MRNSIPVLNNTNPKLYGPTLDINSNTLPLHAWYNANDAGSFGGTYPANAADIATIYDISGNARHLTGGSDKPIFRLGSGPNGTNCFGFDSTGRSATAALSTFFDTGNTWSNHTCVMLFKYIASTSQQVFTGASSTYRAYGYTTSGGYTDYGDFRSRSTSTWLASSWGTDANSHPNTFQILDGQLGTGSLSAPTPTASWQLGGNNYSSGYQIAEIAIYRGSLTKDVVLRLHRGLMKKYAIQNQSENYAIVAIGNSTTALGHWPRLLAEQSTTPNMEVLNCGQGGGTTQNIIDQFDEYTRIARDIKASGRKCLFTILTGHNDGYNTTVSNTLLSSYFDALRSQGHKTLVIGRSPNSNEGDASNHNAMNQVCLNNAAKHDAVIDLRGYDLGTPYSLPATDPNNYYDDTIHFSDAGRTRLVAIIGPTFNTLTAI